MPQKIRNVFLKQFLEAQRALPSSSRSLLSSDNLDHGFPEAFSHDNESGGFRTLLK